MAIVIEEEKNRTNIMGIAGWLVFFAIIVVAAYFIFLAPAESIIVSPPANLASITPISKVAFNPQSITNDKVFQSLQQYVPPLTLPGSAAVGRANPFIPPQ
jgi:hypothetical protein